MVIITQSCPISAFKRQILSQNLCYLRHLTPVSRLTIQDKYYDICLAKTNPTDDALLAIIVVPANSISKHKSQLEDIADGSEIVYDFRIPAVGTLDTIISAFSPSPATSRMYYHINIQMDIIYLPYPTCSTHINDGSALSVIQTIYQQQNPNSLALNAIHQLSSLAALYGKFTNLPPVGMIVEYPFLNICQVNELPLSRSGSIIPDIHWGITFDVAEVTRIAPGWINYLSYGLPSNGDIIMRYLQSDKILGVLRRDSPGADELWIKVITRALSSVDITMILCGDIAEMGEWYILKTLLPTIVRRSPLYADAVSSIYFAVYHLSNSHVIAVTIDSSRIDHDDSRVSLRIQRADSVNELWGELPRREQFYWLYITLYDRGFIAKETRVNGAAASTRPPEILPELISVTHREDIN